MRESLQGLNFARNRALAETSKDIVAFIDDDAVAEPSWIENIQKVFLHYPGAGACTGKISALALDTLGQILFENNGGLMANHQKALRLPTDASHYGWKWRHMPSIAWAVSLGSGCNLSVRRKMALQIGGFDAALDLGGETSCPEDPDMVWRGTVMPGGGDQDMVWRMLDSGAEVIYQPLAKVRHEHRRELKAVYEQILRHQVGMIGLVTKAVRVSGGSERIGAIAFLSWRLIKPGVRLFRRAFGYDELPFPLLLRIWWNCWRCLGAYSKAQKVVFQRSGHAPMSTFQ